MVLQRSQLSRSAYVASDASVEVVWTDKKSLIWYCGGALDLFIAQNGENFTFRGEFFGFTSRGEFFRPLLHFVGFMWGTYLGPAKWLPVA